MCLQRGVGQAKAIKARGGFKDMIKNLSLCKILTLMISMCVIVMVGIYKPKFICYKDDDDKYHLDESKYILFCGFIISLSLLILLQ